MLNVPSPAPEQVDHQATPQRRAGAVDKDNDEEKKVKGAARAKISFAERDFDMHRSCQLL